MAGRPAFLCSLPEAKGFLSLTARRSGTMIPLIFMCAMDKKQIFREWGAFTFLLVFSVVLTSRTCIFSPEGTMIMMTDPATFYMDGKAWANGLVPYVDFIDVKGPLLMFIYMAGWALSPGGPEGIFAVYCLIRFAVHFLPHSPIVCAIFPSQHLGCAPCLFCCFSGRTARLGSASGNVDVATRVVAGLFDHQT